MIVRTSLPLALSNVMTTRLIPISSTYRAIPDVCPRTLNPLTLPPFFRTSSSTKPRISSSESLRPATSRASVAPVRPAPTRRAGIRWTDLRVRILLLCSPSSYINRRSTRKASRPPKARTVSIRITETGTCHRSNSVKLSKKRTKTKVPPETQAARTKTFTSVILI